MKACNAIVTRLTNYFFLVTIMYIFVCFAGHIFDRCISPKTALIEMFLTRSDSRGMGIGTRLIRHAVQRFPTQNTVLVSVPAAVKFYAKQGFKMLEPKMIRMYDMKPVIPKDGLGDFCTDLGVDLVRFNGNDVLLESVINYDHANHGQDRKALLSYFAKTDHCYCLCAKVQASNDDVSGYIVVKRSTDVKVNENTEVKDNSEVKVNAISEVKDNSDIKVKDNTDDLSNVKVVAFVADSPEVASALLRKSFESFSGDSKQGSFCVAFPDTNANALPMYEKLFETKSADELFGYDTFFSTAGPIEDAIHWEKMYTSFELGYMGFV